MTRKPRPSRSVVVSGLFTQESGGLRGHENLGTPAKKKCGARRSDGSTCKNPAGARTDHLGYGRCYRHGGCVPNLRKSARREQAIEAVVTYGLRRDIGPHEALLEEVQWTAGHVLFLRDKVQDLEANELIWGMTKEVNGSVAGNGHGPKPYSTTEWQAVSSMWLQLYDRERKHLIEVCRTAIACGIAEREVRLAERQGELIRDLLLGFLTDVGLDANKPEIRAALHRRLLLAAGREPAALEAQAAAR